MRRFKISRKWVLCFVLIAAFVAVKLTLGPGIDGEDIVPVLFVVVFTHIIGKGRNAGGSSNYDFQSPHISSTHGDHFGRHGIGADMAENFSQANSSGLPVAGYGPARGLCD